MTIFGQHLGILENRLILPNFKYIRTLGNGPMVALRGTAVRHATSLFILLESIKRRFPCLFIQLLALEAATLAPQPCLDSLHRPLIPAVSGETQHFHQAFIPLFI